MCISWLFSKNIVKMHGDNGIKNCNKHSDSIKGKGFLHNFSSKLLLLLQLLF
jgi:hypothetical protein